jgi:ElaB/YqjD/DUF883 family membrane-anchored ribosome-binding protein
MERNQFSSEDSTLGQPAGSTAGSGSSQSGFGSSQGESTAHEKLADVGSSVRERAGTMKNSLADALTSGADRLRQRGTSSGSTAQYAGATDAGSVAVGSDGRTAQVTNKVATGMDATADWLREADLAGLRTSIEVQVKQHPGRTLLIAAGLGYLLGKALRK